MDMFIKQKKTLNFSPIELIWIIIMFYGVLYSIIDIFVILSIYIIFGILLHFIVNHYNDYQ